MKQGRIPETTLACIKYLRSILPNARVSVEIEKPGRKGLQELAAQADVVFYSKAWAEVSPFSVCLCRAPSSLRVVVMVVVTRRRGLDGCLRLGQSARQRRVLSWEDPGPRFARGRPGEYEPYENERGG